MNFPPEYIEICRKLPPHEFGVGDWAINEHFNEPVLVIWIEEYMETLSLLLRGVTNNSYRHEPKNVTWLPHRCEDWMKMDDLTSIDTFLTLDHGIWDYNGGGDWRVTEYELTDWKRNSGIELALEKDPLLALAKAWEKTQ